MTDETKKPASKGKKGDQVTIILGAAHEHKGVEYKKGQKLNIHPKQLTWFEKNNGAKKHE